METNTKTLIEWLPFDYQWGTVDYRIISHLNDIVVDEFDGRYIKWPGSHKNVINWCMLETGYAVGWNESPSIGWSFVIKNMNKHNKNNP